jgi:hypothetical protein
MTEATVNTQNPEITRNHITLLLEKLTLDYQNTKEERKEIACLSPAGQEFSLLEEIELLTVDIRGFASQIQARGWIENAPQAIKRLQAMRVFDIPTLAQFYFTTNNKDYEQMKAYIMTLDYLRLLIIEYLHLSTSN